MTNRSLCLLCAAVLLFVMLPHAFAAGSREIVSRTPGVEAEISEDGGLLSIRYQPETLPTERHYLMVLTPAGEAAALFPPESIAGIKQVYSAQDGTLSATFPLPKEGDFAVLLTGMGQPLALAAVSNPRTAVPVPQPEPLTYSGEPQTGVPESSFYTVSGGSATDAGTYTAELTLRDPENFCWAPPDFTGKLCWRIEKAVLPEQSGKITLCYSGAGKAELSMDEIGAAFPSIPAESAEIEGVYDPSGILEYSGTGSGFTVHLKDGLTQEDAGKTAALTILLHSRNYEDIHAKLSIEVIGKTDLSARFSFAEPTAVRVYNGAPQRLEGVLLDGAAVPEEHVRYEYSAEPVNAGTYTVTAIFEDALHRAAARAVLEIRPAVLTPSVAGHAENTYVKTYDGTADATPPELQFAPATPIENWPQNAPSTADYTVLATFADESGQACPDAGSGKHLRITVKPGDTEKAKNYILSTETLDLPNAKILPKYIQPQVSEPASVVYNGRAQTPEVTVSADGCNLARGRDYTLTYSANLHAGTAELRVQPCEGSNYHFLSITRPFEIQKAVQKDIAFEDILPAGDDGANATKTIVLSELLSGFYHVQFGKPSIAGQGAFTKGVALANGELTITYQPPAKRAETLLTVPVSANDFEPFDLLITLTAEGRQPPPAASGGAGSLLDHTKFIREDGQKILVGTLEGPLNRRGGTAYRSFSEDELRAALSELEGAASQTRKTRLRLQITAGCDAVKLTLPKKSLRLLASAGADLRLDTSAGNALLNAEALLQLARDALGKTIILRFSAEESGLLSFTAESDGEALEELAEGTIRLFSDIFPPDFTHSGIIYESENDASAHPEFDYSYDEERGELTITSSRLGCFQLMRAVDPPLFAPPDAQSPGVQTVVFSDVPPGHWAYPYVTALAAKGIISGVGNGAFAPDQPVTREQFVRLLANAAAAEPSGYTSRFEDVAPERWSAPAIEWAAENGFISGRSNTIFAPTEPISQQEAAAILHRYLLLTGQDVPVSATPVLFADQDKIAAWAAEAVAEMQKRGIVSGSTDGLNRWFLPESYATRAECARMIYVLQNGLNAAALEPTPAPFSGGAGTETIFFRDDPYS